MPALGDELPLAPRQGLAQLSHGRLGFDHRLAHLPSEVAQVARRCRRVERGVQSGAEPVEHVRGLNVFRAETAVKQIAACEPGDYIARMIAFVRVARRSAAVLCAASFAACAGDRAHSPTCGLAQVVGPSLIQQQLVRAPSVLNDAPRGLPETLPARVVGQPQQGGMLVAYNRGQLVMGYQGGGFPTPPGGWALLVVDDSTQRAEGVLVYESEGPRHLAAIGTVTGSERSIPLFGVRVDWAGVNNARCPLLGAADSSVSR